MLPRKSETNAVRVHRLNRYGKPRTTMLVLLRPEIGPLIAIWLHGSSGLQKGSIVGEDRTCIDGDMVEVAARPGRLNGHCGPPSRHRRLWPLIVTLTHLHPGDASSDE